MPFIILLLIIIFLFIYYVSIEKNIYRIKLDIDFIKNKNDILENEIKTIKEKIK